MGRITGRYSHYLPQLLPSACVRGTQVPVKRTLYDNLLSWKSSSRRKPLLLRGARQTGKTWLLREFGTREYDRVAYFDFEADPGLDGFFRRDLDPHRIVDDLSLYGGQEIRPGLDLILFDEIQASDRALTALKYFNERAGEFHLAAAGSLLGVKMAGPGSFPVGKVNFLDLDPMSFIEFLTAMDKPRYARMLENLEHFQPLPDGIHHDLVDLLRKYCYVGGMPEAVADFAKNGAPNRTREIHREIIDSYRLDFAKHATTSDIPKLGLIWDSIPRHLAKENRKFMFSVVRKGARAREYENALRWLHDAGVVHFCHAVSTSRGPLAHYADRSCFKVYPLDVGLLGAMARTPATLLIEGDTLFTEYRGALTESYVAQQLLLAKQRELYYWRSTGGKAEIDFLCEPQGRVVPVEVKAGLSRRSKSLRSYDQQYSPAVLVRTNLRNLKMDGKIANIPLYAASEIPRLAGAALQGEG